MSAPALAGSFKIETPTDEGYGAVPASSALAENGNTRHTTPDQMGLTVEAGAGRPRPPGGPRHFLHPPAAVGRQSLASRRRGTDLAGIATSPVPTGLFPPAPDYPHHRLPPPKTNGRISITGARPQGFAAGFRR